MTPGFLQLSAELGLRGWCSRRVVCRVSDEQTGSGADSALAYTQISWIPGVRKLPNHGGNSFEKAGTEDAEIVSPYSEGGDDCDAVCGILEAGKVDEAWARYRSIPQTQLTLNKYHKLMEAFGTFDSTQSADRILEDAVHVFTASAVTLNILLSLQLEQRNFTDVERSFRMFQSLNVAPTAQTYTLLIRAACSQKKVARAERLLAQMRRRGLKPNLTTFNTIVHGYALCGDAHGASRAVKTMRKFRISPDHITHGNLITLFLNVGRLEDAKEAYDQLLGLDWPANLVTYTVLARYCATTGDCERLVELWTQLRKHGLKFDGPAILTFLPPLVEHGRDDIVHEILDHYETTSTTVLASGGRLLAAVIRRSISEGKDVLWASNWLHTLERVAEIRTMKNFNWFLKNCKSSDLDVVVPFTLTLIGALDLAPNAATLTILVELSFVSGRDEDAMQYFHRMKEYGIEPDIIFYRTWLTVAVEKNDARAIQATLGAMESSGCEPTIVEYTFLARALVLEKKFSRLYEVIDMLSERKVDIDIVFVNEVLNGFSQVGSIHEAQQFLRYARRKSNLTPDRVTHNTVIKLHARYGQLKSAEALLRSMPDADRISFNTLIAASARRDDFERAERLLEMMCTDRKISPDQATYVPLVRALSKRGKVDSIRKHFPRMKSHGILPDPTIQKYLEDAEALEARKNGSSGP